MLRPWSLGDWCIWARRSGSLGLMVGWDRPVKRVVLFGGGGGRVGVEGNGGPPRYHRFCHTTASFPKGDNLPSWRATGA